MPKIMKDTAFHILISLIVAPISVLGFSWIGSEFMKSRDDNIKSNIIAEKLDDIILDNKALIARHDELLIFMNDNKLNIRVIDTKYEERFFNMMEKVNHNKNQITYLKGRLKGGGS